VRTAAAFLAGAMVGGAAVWMFVHRPAAAISAPSSVAVPAAPPAAAPGAAPESGDLEPSPEIVTAAPTDLAAPAPMASVTPSPGDSTDGLLAPHSLVAPADAPALPSVGDLDRLRARELLLPVAGFDVARLRDNFAEARGGRVHEALDLPAPRGTPVLAVDDGVVKKLFTSAAGGLTVYEFDRDGIYSYYYAHLDAYAEGLREGQELKKGDRIGYVGTTGNAPPGTPHLHFTVFKLTPGKRWWEGTPINPFPLWALRR